MTCRKPFSLKEGLKGAAMALIMLLAGGLALGLVSGLVWASVWALGPTGPLVLIGLAAIVMTIYECGTEY